MPTSGHEAYLAAKVARNTLEAPIYDAVHPELTNREESRRLDRMITNAAKCLPPEASANALDLGAGTGFVTGKLLGWGFTVTALDISAAMAARLKRKHAHAVAKGRVRLAIEDADTFLVTERRRYSLIAASAVIHHLPDPSSTFALMAERLEPGGSILLFHEPSWSACGRLERPLRSIDWFLARLFVISWDDMRALRATGLAAHCGDGRPFTERDARGLAKRYGFKVVSFERYAVAQTAPVRWLLKWLVGPSTWSMVLRKPR